VQFILDLPMTDRPGTRWNYNGGTSHLLSALVTGFSDTGDTLGFAREFLFEPIGVTESVWERAGDGICQGGGGLYLRPRDMARFGLLYLNEGVWLGQQVVPRAFVTEAVSTHSYLNSQQTFGYGFQSWWTYPEDGVYYAAGYRGQKIYVVPDLELVVVFTADMDDESANYWQPRLLFDHIIAASHHPCRAVRRPIGRLRANP
jgi:CubicO group peptidase (beta-lactamase class C family)